MHHRFTWIKRLLISLTVCMISACASSVRTEVTTYQRLPSDSPLLSNLQTLKTYSIKRSPEQLRSLEYDQVELLLLEELGPLGLSQAPKGVAPNIMIEFDTKTSESTRIYIEPAYDPYFGYSRFGYARGYRGAFLGPPVYPYAGFPVERKIKVSVHELTVKFFNRDDPVKPIWEGKAKTDSEQLNLNQSMPYLMRGLFKNYPGENGKTVQVDIPTVTKR